MLQSFLPESRPPLIMIEVSESDSRVTRTVISVVSSTYSTLLRPQCWHVPFGAGGGEKVHHSVHLLLQATG